METSHFFRLGDAESYVLITITEVMDDCTAFGGGYNCKGRVEIVSGWFRADGPIWLETGEVFRFYQALRSCYEKLDGQAQFVNEDGTVELAVAFPPKLGHVLVKGVCRQEYYQSTDMLTYTLELDQSYIAETLQQLAAVVSEFGGDRIENGAK